MPKSTPSLMDLANEEAISLGQQNIGTEHLLLALSDQPGTPAARALASRGVSRQALRGALHQVTQIGPASGSSGKLPQSLEVKKAIEYAVEEARALGHTHVGPEHLLLGLMRVSGGIAVRVLEVLGVIPEDMRSVVMQYLGEK
jgi:ATP-dependent Clp protease ATP-binding subunit ClpC